MRLSITRHQLYLMEQDILKFQKDHPGLAIILSEKIDHFLARAGQELAITKNRFEATQAKYVKRDAEGNFKHTTNSEGKMEWDFLDAYTDPLDYKILLGVQVIERFQIECDGLFSQRIHIEL